MSARTKTAPSGTDHDVIIIGAGIIGLATAQKLQEAGRKVTLIDRKGIALETSTGNAGGLAFSDLMPLATAGMWRKVPKWLLDPLGPLTIPPAYLLPILPWLARFVRAGLPDKVEQSVKAQAAMMRIAETEMGKLVKACKLENRVMLDGSLELYESEAELKASAPGWQRRTDEGIPFEHVRGERLSELQPGLSPRIAAGTFVPAWQAVTEPYEFANAIGDHVLAHGAEFIDADVAEIKPDSGSILISTTDGRKLTANTVVIATGAWSKTLTAPLGDVIPLETERGYNTTLPQPEFDLKRQLIFGGHGIVVSNLSTGIRVGGAVELGGLELKPNFARADAMLKKAATFMPGLKTTGGKQWMGFRPSLPDSLPAIGASSASPRIIYAFGHGHLGLTQSAGTGKLVSDLVMGQAPEIDLSPFSPQRF